MAAALMKVLKALVVDEAKIADASEEARLGGHSILANTLAQQGHHHLH